VGEFRANANRRDGLQVWCLLCESNNKARWYKDNIERVRPRLIARQKALKEAQKKVLWDYLLGHPCIDCGEGDPIVLDFDHVSGKKKYNVSIILGKHTLKAMMAEIDKCVVRCSNCHRRKTAKERKTWRNTFGLLAPM
jgi:L-lysine 2,3-aminomutase